jgi:hypothetical protein
VKEFKKRLLEEYKELEAKYERLERFVNSRKIDNVVREEVNRLKWQMKVMDEYLEVLENRLAYYHIKWRD